MNKQEKRHKKKKGGFRKTLIFSVLAIMFALPFSNARAIGLKENSVVKDSTIKLGDIFYGLPRDEERVLGAAPRPGKEMVLNARTLLRIAISLDLAWRPSSSADRVILRREATIIDQDMIVSSIKDALLKKGMDGHYSITIPKEYEQIVLPHEEDATLDITRVVLERNKNRFDVTIAAPSKENPIQQVTLRGNIHPMIIVPVLKTGVEQGRIIQDSDIDYIEVKESAFITGTIIDDRKLIGMTPRRIAFAGRPIKQQDIIAPVIVERGELVIMSLSEGVLNLTAQAKALENGARGDVIRVLNTASNITIQALVTGEKEVRIVSN
jgi:flagella basal body P-ring formation protein FlgA